MKKFEVCVKEISEGYVIVDAENSDKAKRIAIQKCNRGMAIMGDDSDVETVAVKEIVPIGFQSNSKS